MKTVVIVAPPSDEHALAVAGCIKERADLHFLDAESLAHGGWSWNEGLWLGTAAQPRRRPTRGWLRRLAPPDWHRGMQIGSLVSAEAQARLHLLAAATDQSSGVHWLTDYWATMRGENKLIQYEAAARIGVQFPATRVVADKSDLAGLGDPLVLKPLGVGAFEKDGVAYALHAEVVSLDDAALDGLAVAPYIVQQLIPAVRHFRIPTVDGRSWPCELDATGLPLDWRTDDAAHAAWRTSEASGVGDLAVRVAEELGLGYSCQDWVEDMSGSVWLLDVNPGGQWLFLPSETANAVSGAIADWLVGP